MPCMICSSTGRHVGNEDEVRQKVTWIFWAPFAAASLHMFEEFIYPGHFSEWYKDYKPGIQKSVTTRFLIIINVLLLILCYNAGALASRSAGIPVWLCVMALLSANAIWHLVGVVRTHRYSPGVITGLSIHLPLAAYGYFHFLYTEHYPIPVAAVCFAVGASYQFWSNILHRARAKGAI